MHEYTRLKEKQKDSEAMAKSHNILWLKKECMVGGGELRDCTSGVTENIFLFFGDSLNEIIQCKHM